LYGDEELELPEITIQSRESKEEREKEGELEG
jgi:hypothetical protein